jgi:hypothetical protein
MRQTLFSFCRILANCCRSLATFPARYCRFCLFFNYKKTIYKIYHHLTLISGRLFAYREPIVLNWRNKKMKNDVQALVEQKEELAEAASYAVQWIETATSILERQTNVLRGDDPKLAFEALAASVDGLDWLHQFSTAAHHLGDVTILENGESAFSMFGSELLKITTELVHVMEDYDTMLLADLVDHELLPLMDRFRHSISELHI